MRIHDDWTTPAFALAPAADDLGPFPHRPFLQTWWRHRGNGDLMLVESASGLLPLVLGPAGLGFLGEPDLTDYHAPLGDTEQLVAALAAHLPRGTRFRFDSLPGDAIGPLVDGLARAGPSGTPWQHEVTAVLHLPDDYEAFLSGLGSKERHEVRRKGRRFEAAFGEPKVVRDPSPAALGAFVRMHRSAPGEKGLFMSGAMEAFFSALLEEEGWVLDLLVGENGNPQAAALGFEDATGYYLYNSAFDRRAAAASPGVVLIDRLVDLAIAAGRTRFDFLKGDEAYKFRLGAVARPLFAVEGRL